MPVNSEFFFSAVESRPSTGTSIHRLVSVVAATVSEAEDMIVDKWRVQNRYPAGWSLNLVQLSSREYASLVSMIKQVEAKA